MAKEIAPKRIIDFFQVTWLERDPKPGFNPSQSESRAFALNSYGDQKMLIPKVGGFSPGTISLAGLH